MIIAIHDLFLIILDFNLLKKYIIISKQPIVIFEHVMKQLKKLFC